jgi:hypothetical protein
MHIKFSIAQPFMYHCSPLRATDQFYLKKEKGLSSVHTILDLSTVSILKLSSVFRHHVYNSKTTGVFFFLISLTMTSRRSQEKSYADAAAAPPSKESTSSDITPAVPA